MHHTQNAMCMFFRRFPRVPFPACAVVPAVALALLVCTPAPAHAQVARTSTFTGQVLDAETGEPLPGANIRLLQGDSMIRGGATNATGRFEISAPANTYRLTVTYVGYRTFDENPFQLQTDVRRTIRLEPADLMVDVVTITASKRPERVLDAPSAITVLEPRDLQTRTTLTAAGHLASVPGVDIINTGLNASRIVIRGFNDNLASSLLTLVDHRIARAPSVRLTAMQLISMMDGDMEQMEIVSGPASALYGPNAANGVVHMITRTPFDDPGMAISVAGGQRDMLLGSFRLAGLINPRLGYKVSAQYYSGTDFEFFDPEELRARTEALQSGARADTLLIGQRDFNVSNTALSGRLDWRPAPRTNVVLAAGLTQGDNIEVTPTGAAQVNNARIGYAQLRMTRGRLFAQAYANILHSGDSWFLRTGEVFRDRSRLYVAQIQHGADLGSRQRFTYGADFFYTVPEGDGTVNGRNENRDNTTEVGAYLQSETDLTSRLTFVGATRLDHHNHLALTTFSPRAALVFKPAASHTLRATYNLAFSTPKPNDLFSDLVGRRDLFTLGQMEPLLGFRPETNLRAQGMVDGFTVSRSANGLPQYRSPFASLDPRGTTDATYIDLHDPVFTNVMWSVARASSVAGLADNLAATGQIPSDAATISGINDALAALLPESVSGVNNALQLLDLNAQAFVPVNDARDFGTLDVTRTRTFEVGYKGILARALVAQVDVYHTKVTNFLGPYIVGTPNVFLESASLKRYLDISLAEALSRPENAAARDALLPLDTIPLVGNRDGDPSGEASFLISTGVAGAIPFGTVSPVEAFDPTAVLLMRQNFGDVSIWGADVNLLVFLSRNLRVGLLYSRVSENWFPGQYDLSLNAPRHKGGGQFTWDWRDFSLNTRARYVGSFRVRSDVYEGFVDSFLVFDTALTWTVRRDTRANLTIQNITDNRHREFVLVPELGRLATLRLTHEF